MDNYFQKWCCLIIFNPEEKNSDQLISTVSSIDCAKHFYFNKEIINDVEQKNKLLQKHLLQGEDLGTQMQNAFSTAFAQGFRKVVLIKNNFDTIQTQQIIEAFNCLKMIEFCIGPKDDGDYYLLGMNYFEPSLFINKQWNTSTVLKETIKDIGKLKLALYKLTTLKSEEYVTAINT